MILDIDRYRYTTKKKKKRGRWIIIPVVLLIVLATLLVIARISGILNFPRQFRITNNEGDILLNLWNKQAYDALIEKTDRILKKNPLNSTAIVFRGFSYFYKAISESTVENRNSYLFESIKSLRRAKILKPQSIEGEIAYILGKAYFYLGRYYYDSCVEYINRSLELGFKANDQYEYLGLAYAQLGEIQKSIDAYMEALKYKTSDVILLSIAKNYLQLKNYKKSEEYLLRTINTTKDPIIEKKSRLFLGSIYLKQGKLIKAETQYKKIIGLDAKSADAHYYLGEVYQRMGKYIAARAEWREALRINPNHYAAKLKYYK